MAVRKEWNTFLNTAVLNHNIVQFIHITRACNTNKHAQINIHQEIGDDLNNDLTPRQHKHGYKPELLFTCI